MHTTATAQATETRNPLSFDEIQVSAWLLSENKPHEVEIALDRNGAEPRPSTRLVPPC